MYFILTYGIYPLIYFLYRKSNWIKKYTLFKKAARYVDGPNISEKRISDKALGVF